MLKLKWFIPFIAITVILIVISCGDDEVITGPGDNPTASTLLATSGTTNTVFASWTMCPDNDFSEYSLYRSTSSGISANPPSSPISTASNASDTTFSDTGLEWGDTYYYAVQTKNSGNYTVWSNEVHVVIADSGSSSGYLTCYEIQGQQADSPYDGQIVSITGIVTTGGDELYSTLSYYAVISDAGGGPWSGLILYGDSVASLTRGDSITISGTVDEFYGLTELTLPTDVQVISTGHTLPDAITLSTAAVCEEQYESVVVSVTDAIVLVQNDHSYEIDDGGGSCHMGTRGTITEPSVGDTVDVKGPLFYEYDEWRIQPRDNNDITINGGGGGGDAYTCYEIQGQQEDSPFYGQTVSVTGIVTADPDDYTATSSIYSALSDAGGGPWSGLLMYSSDLAGLQSGDSVTVTGVVDEYFGMTELKYPLSYVVHSTGHSLPDPIQFSTGDLATSENPEQWESVSM
ncbi:MAG: hypothetical protein K8S14_02950 [Actinomycetia bacterium]|nr:hypothetical protein [Actinomycetes bacterium]